MQKNKKKLLILVTAVGLILLVIMGYPAVDDHIHEMNKGDIFLDQVQETDTRDISPKNRATTTQLPDTDPGKPLPEITLSLEDDTLDFHVSLWQSDSGTCYFFLPGFARDMGLVLGNSGNHSIYINDVRITPTAVLRGIAEEEYYDLSVLDAEAMLSCADLLSSCTPPPCRLCPLRRNPGIWNISTRINPTKKQVPPPSLINPGRLFTQAMWRPSGEEAILPGAFPRNPTK